MLSNQAIISGIRIGGLRESEAIQAIYNQFESTLLRIADLKIENFEADLIRETIECFVNGIKSGLITAEEGEVVEAYLKEISQKIKNPEEVATDKIERLFEDKVVWDYYLDVLAQMETSGTRILTRSFGQEVLVDDLADRLVARGEYNSVEEVKAVKYDLITRIMAVL